MEVPRNKLDLKDDPAVLSPPILTKPLYACAKVVNVTGYVPGATLDLEIDGAIAVTAFDGGSPSPSGATIHPPSPLVLGQQVRVRQNRLPAMSDWSGIATVTDHTVDYPTGLPRPKIFGSPFVKDSFEGLGPPTLVCGVRTGVENLLVGCDVSIVVKNGEADQVVTGTVAGAVSPQGVDVSPAYRMLPLTQHGEVQPQVVRARAELCGDTSPLSFQSQTLNWGGPLLIPGFEPIFSGASQIVLTSMMNGARVTLVRNNTQVGTFPVSGGNSVFSVHPPVHDGEMFSATQELCVKFGPGPSQSGTVTVQACSALPAPKVGPVQAGDSQIVLTEFLPGSEIKVFVNNVKTGDGSGPTVALTGPVPHGATIDVWQILGVCVGSTVQQVQAKCVNPPLAVDPAALDLYPAWSWFFSSGHHPIVVDGVTWDLAANIFYPSEDDTGTPGVTKAPFNKRLAASGRTPVVIVKATFGDFEFEQKLAKMGFIAVSLYDTKQLEPSGPPGEAQNLAFQADVGIALIAHLQEMDKSDQTFKGRFDFERLGLMGLGHDGDCVIAMAERMKLKGVIVRAVLTLAPTNTGANSGTPHGYAFMTILPAADGVVVDNDGAQYYDQATPDPFKVQLYVDKANHNFFKPDSKTDDTNGELPVMSRADHVRLLSTYACAFFRNALRGDATFGYLDRTLLPEHVQNQNIHMSYEVAGARTVDNYEKHPITIDNEGAATARLNGITAQDFPFAQVSGAFNPTFFGKTTGIVCSPKDKSSSFREPLKKPADLTKAEVRVRAAEVYREPIIPPDAAGFRVGVEDTSGTIAWVDVNSVGGLPRPFGRRAFDFAHGRADKTKTMLSTFRFPGSCFAAVAQSLKLNEIQAIHLGLNQPDGRSIAFDDLEIVNG